MQNRRRVIHCPDEKRIGKKEYSGVYGPGQPGPADSYIGNNLLHKDENRAIVRGGGAQHMLRIMMLGFFGILLAGGTLVMHDEYERYLRGADDLKVGDSFLENDIDLLIFTYQKYKEGVFTAGDLFWGLYKYLLFVPGFVFCVLLILLPMPAPLCFDRKRRLVYTFKGGHVWMADFDTMPMWIVSSLTRGKSGLVRTTNLICLYRQDGKAWKRSFKFSIAALRYFRESWAWHDGFPDGAWRWMIDYMDKGPEAVHDRIYKVGMMDLLTPFTRKLPDDIEARVDRLIEEAGGAPGDTNLPPRPPPDPLGAFLGQFPGR